ncbi:hypothetical protein [uncultured Roseobacter sp.]|uniref:hypothetical protein n=1 Tax=uncultured Roseobacter sp. TaxID=114847 RepID=UPI00261501EE|nr:hypothetical protein [uncultured Roseobacter sp.]
MTPELALSLSHEGIRLLQKNAAGWDVLREVDPEAADLDEQLNGLLGLAQDILPAGQDCTIILPDNQIRYMDVPVNAQGEDDAGQARSALEGQTPYDTSDLVVATETSGPALYIAAVARETLDEADAFARAHGFNPVSFTAAPDRAVFPGAPVFTTGAAATPVPAGELQTGPGIQPEPVEETPVFSPPTYERPAPRHAGFADDPAPFLTWQPREERPRPAVPVASVAAHQASKLEAFGDRHNSGQTRSWLLSAGTIGALAAVFAVGVGVWASGLLGTGGLQSLLNEPTGPAPDAQFAAPLQPEVPQSASTTAAPAEPLQPVGTGTDAAIREALSVPVEPALPPETPQEPLDDLARYAASGIWSVAPDVPSPPPLIDLENLYVTSVDPVQAAFDAVALPDTATTSGDAVLLSPASPAPAGTVFVLNDRGFVIPTAQGALNPDGIRVFAGAPPARPPDGRVQVIGEASVADPVLQALLAGFRPRLRPGDLVEQSERAAFSGLTRSELAGIRPALRPRSLQEQAAALAETETVQQAPRSGTAGSLFTENGAAPANAVARSLRPETRPSDFSITVARVLQNAPKPAATPAPATVTTASVAPTAVAPRIPSSTSAAREATQKNAINLRRVNLIGVYGKPSDRRALIRLGNGRYQKVKVGDRLDGGQVSAIGDAELRYQKSGRNIVLKMPSG